MEGLLGVEHYTDEIDAVAREQRIDRDTAAIVVAIRYGDLVGDVLIVGTLTKEQKRRRRMTLREVMRELGELPQDQDADSVVASSDTDRHGKRPIACSE